MITLIGTNIRITSKYVPPKGYLKLKIIICSPNVLQSTPMYKSVIYEIVEEVFLGRKLLVLSNVSKM